MSTQQQAPPPAQQPDPPEEPQFDPSSAIADVEAAFDAEGGTEAPEFAGAKMISRKRIKPSETVLKLDKWHENKGRRLAQEDQYKPYVKAGAITTHDLADAHAACFEFYVELHENPKDKMRSEWMQQLMETPEFKAVRATTNFDMVLSDMSCKIVVDQWVEYKKHVQQNPDKDDEHARMRSAASAARQAKQGVDEAEAVAKSFGLEKGSRTMFDPKMMLKLFQKMKQSPDLKRICELAGRYRRLAQARQRVRDIHAQDEVVDVTLGGEIERLIGSEITRLALPELEDELLVRISERRALVHQKSGVKRIAKGPIMVLIDESGSMGGEPIQQAKAMALSLAWVAKAQGRWCALVSWSSGGQYNYISLPPGEWDGMKVADWCCGFIGGGTQPPIDKVDEIFQNTGAIEGKTDMVWISDGCAHIDPNEAHKFNEWRAEHNARSISMLVEQDDEAFRRISDEIHVVKSIDVEESAVGEILSI